MNVPTVSRAPIPAEDRWLTAIRITWLFVAVAVLILWIPVLRSTFTSVEHPCVQPSCDSFQVTAQTEQALRTIGMSLHAYGAYTVALILVRVVVGYLVAVALMWRRSRDRMLLLTAFGGMLAGTVGLQGIGGPWATPIQVVTALGAISVALLLYCFPTGSFVPSWTALLALGFAVLLFLPNSAFPNAFWANAPWLLFVISIIALQIYRYRRVSNPLQRQQTKLVVLGIGILCANLLIETVVSLVDVDIDKQAVPYLLIQTASDLAGLPVLLSIGLAVLRYRLWDVDVLINRTLVYLALTASLALLYLGSVVGLQAVLRILTGQQSDLAVAISTLVIAALFNPLRHRIQDLIARTFYRRKYDAAQVLATFGAACRNETDLGALQSNLIQAVQDTMQPGHVSIWLRQK